LFFNVRTDAALIASLSVQQEDRLMRAPERFGSIAFLISSAIALASSAACRRA
jgi:hypothetical protein